VYKFIQQIVSGCLIDTEHISTYFGKGQGTYPITTKVYIRARPTIRVWQKTPSFNKIDVVANQIRDRLPILRRKNALPTDIARYNKSPWSTKGHPIQVILSNPKYVGPEMSTGKESSTYRTHPANRDRMPYRHRTYLNVLQQGPRHLPDNKAIV
jgi:hypothetical protein